ncbi:condensation domain-containing protein [Luteimonas salinilitoris]|uniref:Condensation domain-containing protein n=1 Tax=Luteimonas salinilitoris TaxID=3237697 RepID=A0ABV4HMT2_9GAMM
MSAERPLTLFERGLYLDGTRPVNIVFVAGIRGRLPPERLRHALARVQDKHPLLRCAIVQRDGRPWFRLLPRPAPIPLRVVARTGDDDWRRQSAHERRQRFDGSREPLVRAVWLRGEGAGELLLVCHHCICDGRSIVTLLREILALCDRPDLDIGGYRSLDPAERLLPDAVLGDRGLRRRSRWMAGLFGWLVRIRRPGPELTYGDVYSIHWTLDQPASLRLARRCEREGVTVFNALAAASVLGFRAVRGTKGAGRFMVPVDARRFLPKLADDHLFAMAPTVALSPRVPHPERTSETGFWTLARTLRRDLDRRIGRLGAGVHRNLLGMEHLHALFDRLIAHSRSRRSGRNVTLSWLGRLDLPEDYREFRIEAVHSPSATLQPTPANLLVVLGFAGRLEFALTSDEVSLPRAQAMAIRETSLRLLRAHARLPEDAEARAGHAPASPQADAT